MVEKGGSEHALLPEMETWVRLWKMTKGSGFVWYPLCEDLTGTPSDALTMRFDSPSQYLLLLLLLNELVREAKPGLACWAASRAA